MGGGAERARLPRSWRWPADEHGRPGRCGALEEKAIAGVVLHEPLGSLKELIESSRDFSASPELFCFGLLASFDLASLPVLAPRPVELHRASDRAKAELAGDDCPLNGRGGSGTFCAEAPAVPERQRLSP